MKPASPWNFTMPSGVIRLPGTKCPINSEPNCNCIPLVSLINLPSTCLESRKFEMLGGGFLTAQRIVPKPGRRPNKMSPLQTPGQKERSPLTTDNAGPLILFLLCSLFPGTKRMSGSLRRDPFPPLTDLSLQVPGPLWRVNGSL